MSEIVFLDLLQQTLMLILILSAPILGMALVVGLAISLFQAVTQIQESTLTFVPKILACMLTLVVLSPWMVNLFLDHTTKMLKNLSQMTVEAER